MKVVFDTNLVASASFWRGEPFDCLCAWAEGHCAAVVSPQLLSEYFEVDEELRARHPERQRAAWPEALAQAAELVFPLDRARGATPDPDDEIVLECALAGDAACIVTGDKKHLLALREWRGIKIVSADVFLVNLKKPSA